MKTSLHHRIHGDINPLLAITIAVIAIGSGILRWEWLGALSAKHQHSKSSQHQHTKTHHTADAGGKSAKNG